MGKYLNIIIAVSIFVIYCYMNQWAYASYGSTPVRINKFTGHYYAYIVGAENPWVKLPPSRRPS